MRFLPHQYGSIVNTRGVQTTPPGRLGGVVSRHGLRPGLQLTCCACNFRLEEWFCQRVKYSTGTAQEKPIVKQPCVAVGGAEGGRLPPARWVRGGWGGCLGGGGGGEGKVERPQLWYDIICRTINRGYRNHETANQKSFGSMELTGASKVRTVDIFSTDI